MIILFLFFFLQYDPRSRPTFAEIVQKLDLLLEKYDGDAKNGKKPSTNATTTNKRYSIDNQCSNWLQIAACKSPHTDSYSNSVNEKIHSFIGKEKAANDHEQHQTHNFEENKLQHRRSLSENIIPFPPHTTPSDKARCHLLNRRNSQLNASSGKLHGK